jgi:hypothetical protein
MRAPSRCMPPIAMCNPYYSSMSTVRDLVMFLNAQPRVA